MNEIRNYSGLDNKETASLRQLDERDIDLYSGYAVAQGEVGAWVIDTRYDSGMGATLVDVRDVLKEVARTNPQLLVEALKNAGVITQLR